MGTERTSFSTAKVAQCAGAFVAFNLIFPIASQDAALREIRGQGLLWAVCPEGWFWEPQG